MLKKILKIFVVLAILAFVLLVIRGSEDTWICENPSDGEAGGEWVKHGVPSAPKPTEPC